MPRISLCMIVRDEEDVLARCLASARDVVDEICIVDTGSVDGTVAIAEEWGARVERLRWPDSFAEARNASLEMATGDWILVLDADEVLVGETAGALRVLAGREDLAGALLAFRHHTAAGVQPGRVLRFFRNDPAHRFVGAVHEQLAPAFEEQAARRGQRVLMSEVRVEHDGYLPAVRDAKQKDERNRRLFERAVREDPDNDFLAYKYADFLRGGGDGAQAVAVLEPLCERLLSGPGGAAYAFHAEAVALLSLELLAAGRVEEAGAWLARAADRFPPTAHFHFALGRYSARAGRWSDALAAFRACRTVDGPASVQVPAPGILTWKSSLGIAEALEELGRHGEAEEILRDETLRSPDVPTVRRAHASLLARAGRLPHAVEACFAGLRRFPEHAGLWTLCAELLLAGGSVSRARSAAERAVALARPAARARAEEIRRRCAGAAG